MHSFGTTCSFLHSAQASHLLFRELMVQRSCSDHRLAILASGRCEPMNSRQVFAAAPGRLRHSRANSPSLSTKVCWSLRPHARLSDLDAGPATVKYAVISALRGCEALSGTGQVLKFQVVDKCEVVGLVELQRARAPCMGLVSALSLSRRRCRFQERRSWRAADHFVLFTRIADATGGIKHVAHHMRHVMKQP